MLNTTITTTHLNSSSSFSLTWQWAIACRRPAYRQQEIEPLRQLRWRILTLTATDSQAPCGGQVAMTTVTLLWTSQ